MLIGGWTCSLGRERSWRLWTSSCALKLLRDILQHWCAHVLLHGPLPERDARGYPGGDAKLAAHVSPNIW